MNERDLQLAEAINEIMDETNEPSIYLIHTKYTNVVRVNLVVLKAFLERKAKKGIMITIDRLHQYVSHPRPPMTKLLLKGCGRGARR